MSFVFITLSISGLDAGDKLLIGSKMCSALLEKISFDLNASQSNTKREDMHYLLDESHAEDLQVCLCRII